MRILKTFLFSGLSAFALLLNTSGVAHAQSQTLLEAGSAEELAEILSTGRTKRFSDTYWDCLVESNAQNANRIHVRLWSDQTGFSGVQPVSWAVDSANTLSISYARGSFQLQQIRFESERYDNDGFTAVNQNFEGVSCQRIGPLRTEQVDSFTLLEDDNTNLLEGQITNFGETRWFCEITNDAGLRESRQLQFRPGNVGTHNDSPSNWFVDEQYNIIIGHLDGIDVIREVAMSNSDNANGSNSGSSSTADTLTGKILNKSVACNLV